jgi:dolichol kinase
MVLSVGDAFSTLIGKFHGRTKFHRLGFKSVEGSLAFVVSAFLTSMIFVDQFTAAKLASVGAVVELISPWDVNFTVPVALTILTILLP